MENPIIQSGYSTSAMKNPLRAAVILGIEEFAAALRQRYCVSSKMSLKNVSVVPFTDQAHKESSDTYDEEKAIEFLVKKAVEHFTSDKTEHGCASLTSILAMMEPEFALMAADSRVSSLIVGTSRRERVNDNSDKLVEVQDYVFISGSGRTKFLDPVENELPDRFEETFSVRFSRLESTVLDVVREIALLIGSILADTGEDPRKAGNLDFVVAGAVQNSVGAYRITKVEGVMLWDFVVVETTDTILKVGSGSEAMERYVENHPQDKFVHGANAVMFSQRCIEYASEEDSVSTGGDIDIVLLTKGEGEVSKRKKKGEVEEDSPKFVYRRKPGRRLFTYFEEFDKDGKKVYDMFEWPGGRKSNLESNKRKKVNG